MVCSTVLRHAWLSETSACKAWASTPRSWHKATTFSAWLIELVQVTVIFQPFDASKIAVAWPTPRLPPVIIATGLVDLDIQYSLFGQSWVGRFIKRLLNN